MAAEQNEQSYSRTSDVAIALLQQELSQVTAELGKISIKLDQQNAQLVGRIEFTDYKTSVGTRFDGIDLKLAALGRAGGWLLGIVSAALVGAVLKLILKV